MQFLYFQEIIQGIFAEFCTNDLDGTEKKWYIVPRKKYIERRWHGAIIFLIWYGDTKQVLYNVTV